MQAAMDVSKSFTDSQATCVLFSQWERPGRRPAPPACVLKSGSLRCFHHCAEGASCIPGTAPGSEDRCHVVSARGVPTA